MENTPVCTVGSQFFVGVQEYARPRCRSGRVWIGFRQPLIEFLPGDVHPVQVAFAFQIDIAGDDGDLVFFDEVPLECRRCCRLRF